MVSHKSSKKSSSLKDKCECLANYCRNCYGVVIDMLVKSNDKTRKLLCNYLKCCLTLCAVCCCCSCCMNMNCMTAHQMSDLVAKCNAMCSVCDELKSVLTASQYNKIGCKSIRNCCSTICGKKSSKKKSKKGSRKSKKGGAIRHSSEYFGKDSGRYSEKTSQTGRSSPFGKLSPSKENMIGGGSYKMY